MRKNPLVSIVINNYNYGRFLQEAIDSALNQSYPYTEVIVVDDGSTDDSREIIASYGDRITPVLKENGGQASAFNAGFSASRGEIICFLDSDDVFYPNKVEKIVATFGRYQDAGWCFHPLTVVDKDARRLLEIVHGSPPRECDFRPHARRGKLPFMPPGFCFRRSLLQQILPMPEAATVSISDNYLRFVALALSKGVLLNEELAVHRIHGGNSYAFRDDKQQLRARMLVLTAYWMRARVPSAVRFTNKLLAAGISTYWRAGGAEADSTKIIKSYLSSTSVLERTGIVLRALYYRLRDDYRNLRGYAMRATRPEALERARLERRGTGYGA